MNRIMINKGQRTKSVNNEWADNEKPTCFNNRTTIQVAPHKKKVINKGQSTKSVNHERVDNK